MRGAVLSIRLSAFSSQLSAFSLTSYFRLQTPDFRLQTSNFRLQSSRSSPVSASAHPASHVLGRRRDDILGPQVHSGRAVHLVAVNEDAVKRRDTRHLVIA